MFRLIKRLVYLGVFMGGTSLLSGCFVPDAIVKSGDLANDLVAQELLTSHLSESDAARIHYVMRKPDAYIGDASQTKEIQGANNLVVFVHGTPGSWTVFSPQLGDPVLTENAVLIALDRPGWGESSITNDDGDLSLARQSELIGPVLAELRAKFESNNVVLVGHSLGGSLVPRMAMDYPELVDTVVVLAGDLTDDYSAAHWYNDLATWWPVQWILPKVMAKANKEVLALNDSLAEMKPLWRDLKAPVLIVQGDQDGLVDPRHADFAEAVETDSDIRVARFPDGGHLVHITHAEEVSKLIAEVILRNEGVLSAGVKAE